MDDKQAQALREPFPPEKIGKLPKPTSKDNAKGRCSECGGWHGLPAVHLDYVGHAATTDRLLQVDPAWTWEPMVVGPNGEPLLVNGGLWIKLTVCGVTRPGWGDGASVKEMIGDAIRNAAMRFGVALDLWAKEDLHGSAEAPEPRPEPDPGLVSASQRKLLFAKARERGMDEGDMKALLREVVGVDSTKLIPVSRLDSVLAAISDWVKPDADGEAPLFRPPAGVTGVSDDFDAHPDDVPFR